MQKKALAIKTSILISIFLVLTSCAKRQVLKDDLAPRPMYMGNVQHTGVSLSKPIKKFHGIKWFYKTDVPAYPIAYNHRVFFGGDNIFLAVNSKTGELLWKKIIEGSPDSQAAIGNNTVFFGSGQRFYALNTNNGAQIWSKKIKNTKLPSEKNFSSPNINNETIYFTSASDCLYAVNTKTGKLLWTFQDKDDTNFGIQSNPALAYGFVFYTAYPNKCYSLDAKTGKKIWEFKVKQESVVGETSIESSPSVINGKVFFGTNTISQLYVIDAFSGRKKWVFQAGGKDIVSTPSHYNKSVFFGNDSSLYSVNNQSGKRNWRLDFKVDSLGTSSAVVSGDLIYVATSSGRTICVNQKGTFVWKKMITSNNLSTPFIYKGMIFVGSEQEVLGIN